MPNREQRQNQQQKGPRNPPQVAPDDDEVEDTDEASLGAQDQREPNQPQQGRRRPQDLNQDQEQVTQIEDEEAEDDEDEDDGKEDGSGARV